MHIREFISSFLRAPRGCQFHIVLQIANTFFDVIFCYNTNVGHILCLLGWFDGDLYFKGTLLITQLHIKFKQQSKTITITPEHWKRRWAHYLEKMCIYAI